MKSISLFAISSFLAANCAIAKPVEFDTPDVHIVVTRALDNWDQNNSVAGYKYISSNRAQKYNFKLLGKNDPTETEAIHTGVQIIANAAGFTNESEKPATFFFFPSNNLTGQEANNYSTTQNKLWEYRSIEFFKTNAAIAASTVVSEGGIWSAIGDGLLGGLGGLAIGSAVGKSVGGFVGSAIAGGGAAALGANIGVNIGAQTTQASSNDPIKPEEDLQALLKNPLYGFNQVPIINYAQYHSVDVIKVAIANGNTGTVLIAYKKNKTPEIAQLALIQAIPSAMSVDEKPVDRAMSADKNYKDRLKIWELYCDKSGC